MGGGSYSQVHIHLIFVVKGRQSLIQPNWEADLHKYITGILHGKGHKSLAINGMPDHIHIFFGYKLTDNIPDLVREIKKSTSIWIKDRGVVKGNFYWQEGYAAFSYSNWDVEKIKNYVLNQKTHHQKTTFKREFISLLGEFEIPFEDKYLFDFLE